MGEGQHGACALASDLSLLPLHHVAGFECWEEDEVEVVDQEACGLVVELVDQVDYADPHAVCGLAHIPALSAWGLGRPADELVEVVAEALDASEVVPADLAGVGFGEPGEEGAYAGVQCDDACLGLAFASLCLERDRQVILAVVQGHPAVLVPAG